MYKEKFLLFSTGGASADPRNTDRHEMAIYSIKDFRGMKPHRDDNKTHGVDLFFTTDKGREIVTLKTRTGLQAKVMQSISTAIVSSNQSVIPIADIDNGVFINPNIYGVVIRVRDTYIQSLTSNSRVQINLLRDNYRKCIVANNYGGSAVGLTLELYDGTTFTKLLNVLQIYPQTSLVLEEDEIAFDSTVYTLQATSDNASGLLTFTFIY